MSRKKSGNLLQKIGVKAGVLGGIWMLVVKLNLHKNQEDRCEMRKKRDENGGFVTKLN